MLFHVLHLNIRKENEIKNGAKTLIILPHKKLTLTVLPWKINPLLLCRLLLVTVYFIGTKSSGSIKPVFRKSTFHVWASGVNTVIFQNTSIMQFYSGRQFS
jgi:hypothetical protein